MADQDNEHPTLYVDTMALICDLLNISNSAIF